MNSFLRDAVEGKKGQEVKRYFLRFGKGQYNRRFRISFQKGKQIKIRASYEFANDFVNFIRENKDVKFSGKVMSLDKIEGKTGRKKGASYTYEITESSIDEFENVYYYLLNANAGDIVLKIKKSLPKPGKEEDKIDDKFCSLDLDLKYWEKVKEMFFWDVSDCKKANVEHDIIVEDVELPKGEENPTKIRELAVRKGKIVRRIECDGKQSEKEYKLEI